MDVSLYDEANWEQHTADVPYHALVKGRGQWVKMDMRVSGLGEAEVTITRDGAEYLVKYSKQRHVEVASYDPMLGGQLVCLKGELDDCRGHASILRPGQIVVAVIWLFAMGIAGDRLWGHL